MSVSYDNGANAEPLSKWMQRNIFLEEKPVDTNIRITRKANHVEVKPIEKLENFNNVKRNQIYKV